MDTPEEELERMDNPNQESVQRDHDDAPAEESSEETENDGGDTPAE